MRLEHILKPVKEDLLEFDRKVKDYIYSDSPLIYQIASHILKGKGKRLRPSLVYLSAGACGKKSKKLTQAASAIELIHTATLLHDDVVDGSPTRRGQPTVNSQWNNLVSVLMGDYLFAKAFKIMMETKSQSLLSAISGATERVSVGELLQVQECFNYDLDEKSYLSIIQEKTASLFSVACEAGAILCSLKDDHRKEFKTYGENFGIAFQIRDDLLDLIGEKERTGKEPGNDLKEGKITLPLIHALKNASSSERKEVVKILDDGFDQDGFEKVLIFIKEQKGMEYAHSRAREYGDKALNNLSHLDGSEYKQALAQLVNFAVSREK
jgi:octaprenyl-diphosphate synthase